jgi:hypothetical protein
MSAVPLINGSTDNGLINGQRKLCPALASLLVMHDESRNSFTGSEGGSYSLNRGASVVAVFKSRDGSLYLSFHEMSPNEIL